MEDQLTKQDRVFVKELVETGNKTQSAKKAYKYKDDNVAGVMANKRLKKVKIQNAIKSIADALPDLDLIKVHKEGLQAGKRIFKNNNETGEIEDLGIEPDYATRHKYLDSAYKIKGTYAPEKVLEVGINIDELNEEQKNALLGLLKK